MKKVKAAAKKKSAVKKTGKRSGPAKKSGSAQSVNKVISSDGRTRTVKKKHFPVVGLGGSAGALQAFEKFFTHLPPDSGMAFVIIMHLDPNHRGNVAEYLQRFTPIPLVQAQDGMAVEPDHVYVIPPNKDMGIHNRQLLLLPPILPKGHRMPIDHFFQSLADDQMNKAVAIIFSGMGSDGEIGVRMIKEKLGMAMAQDPSTCEHPSMPKSAIATNLVDFVLAPEEMPIKLIQYLRHPGLNEEPSEQTLSDSRNSNALQKVLLMLRSATGHDFSLYKKNTITRRIDRRLALHQLNDYSHYVNYLRENPQELDILFKEVLIGVTKFFRDAAAFEALRERMFPVLSSKPDGEPIRVWVAGCSTGEEAYSIAILLMEYLETVDFAKPPKVQIFATDLDAAAIEQGRIGVYHENIIADVSPERLDKYFVKKEGHYAAKKELREMIVFAQHNIIKDAPFTRLDLLTCRNLMIYLGMELQKKLIPIFHYSLNPKGILLLGPAETIGGFSDMFHPVQPKWKLFERKEGPATMNRMLDFPFHISTHGVHALRTDLSDRSTKKTSLHDTFIKILLENYTPASLLINEKGDILYINGKTGRYLELSPGEAVMNIHRMAREELRYALSNAIHQARQHKGMVTINDIRLKGKEEQRMVNLRVSYLDAMPVQGIVLVVFEEGAIVKPDTVSRKGGGNNPAAEELEKELFYTKQQLHTTIEQMETSLEELKSTNEELQSTNEELQSTNEESLTTKEEMQSLNEELMTINMQYQSKAEELNQLNNDMKNMLDNIEAGTIFLDNDLNILRFTPQVKRLFSLIPSDVGRSLTHIVSAFDRASLENDVLEVIETLKDKELEVRTLKGDWYSIRMTPYRTLDNFISGAVLTFNRITALKDMKRHIDTLKQANIAMINELHHPALLLDEELTILAANKVFFNTFRLQQKDIDNRSFHDLLNHRWQTKKLNKTLKKLTSETTVSLEIGSKSFMVMLRPVSDETNASAMVIVIMKEE